MTKVKLIARKTFSNRGAEKIQEGETFEVNEGMANDYIMNGLAFLPDTEQEKIPSISQFNDAGEVVEVSLSSMKLNQLRSMALSKGIQNANDMNKAELVSALSVQPK